MSSVNAANVIARALIPIIGILLLDWSGATLLGVYFAGTLASMYALMVVVGDATLLHGAEHQAWVKDGLTLGKRLRAWCGVVGYPLSLLAVVSFFFGALSRFVMLELQGELPPARPRTADRGRLPVLRCLRADGAPPGRGATGRGSEAVRQIDVGTAGRALGALVLVGFLLSRYSPRIIYGPLLIVTYAVATALLELAPERVMALLDNAKGPPRKR